MFPSFLNSVSSAEGYIMGGATWNKFSYSVVSDIIYGANCSQQYKDIQFNFLVIFSYPILTEAHKRR